MKICDENRCSGCCTCFNACPKNCITMKENEYGVIVPKIDEEKCIKCNICKNICPENNNSNFNTPIEVYASWSKDDEIRKRSSSGGIAYEMYKYIIANGGIAIGTAFDEQMNLKHMVGKSLEDLDMFRGSKYVQSYIGKIYKEVKEYLKLNKKVVFVGTPCQVNGLNKYLKKKYLDNLITVDLVCHGVPPIKYLKEYLKYINITNVDKITFRGENNRHFTGYSKGNIIYKKHSKEDIYYKAFLEGILCRESCYNCNYARKERVSDITIGDFWGLGKEIPFNYSIENGVSLIMVNTQNGKKFINQISDYLFLEKRTLEEAIKENLQLQKPIKEGEKRLIFKQLYKKYGFNKAIENYEIS